MMEIEIFGWTPLDYLQTIVDGILFGATYAIIAIGFTLIFGVMDKLNLAYAATALAGAYLSWGVGTQIPLPAPARLRHLRGGCRGVRLPRLYLQFPVHPVGGAARVAPRDGRDAALSRGGDRPCHGRHAAALPGPVRRRHAGVGATSGCGATCCSSSACACSRRPSCSTSSIGPSSAWRPGRSPSSRSRPSSAA